MIRGLLLAQGIPEPLVESVVIPAIDQVEKKVKKKTRSKLNSYQKWMKKEMKILRKKHPRMSQARLMQEAARIWRGLKRNKKR